MICCNTDPVSLCSLCSKYPLVFCRFKMKTPVQEQLLDLLDDLGEEETYTSGRVMEVSRLILEMTKEGQ